MILDAIAPQTSTLRYHLKYKKQPLLSDVAQSLAALANEYDAFARAQGFFGGEAQLHVAKVEEGSIIVELREFASATILPMMEGLPTVVAFAEHIGKLYNKMMKGESPDSKSSAKNLSDMVQPAVRENGATLNITIVGNNNNVSDFAIGYNDANSLQNKIRNLSERSKEKVEQDICERVILRIQQMDADERKTTDKGVVEEISPKAVKLLFDPDIKAAFTQGEENPFTKLYYVDVKPMHSEEKLVAYRVVKLHESFSTEA